MPRPWPRNDRGFVLWLFGLAFALVGLFSYVLTEPPAVVRATLVIPFEYLHLPPAVWGCVFIFIGGFAAASSYDRENDRNGYTALTTLTAFWGLCYLAGVPLGGSVRGFGGAVIYGLFALMLYRLAGYDDTLDAESMVQ